MCSPSVVPIVLNTYVHACTAFGMYEPSGVRVAQKYAGV